MEDRKPRPRPNGGRGESGFSLAEMIIGMAVMAEVLVVVLILFDVNSRLARVQTQITDMQQSQRIAQHDLVRNTRMAGRGGLAPTLAVTTRQGVAANTRIADAEDAPRVAEGTDVVVLRGVFSTPIYQVNYVDSDTFTLDLDNKTGTIVIDSLSRTQVPQPVDALERMAGGGEVGPEALILVSSIDDAIYAVVEIDAVRVQEIGDLDGDGNNEKQATIDFNFDPATGTHTSDYLALSPGGTLPAALTDVAYAGVLEEYRYYIGEDFAIPGDDLSGVVPRLARARMFPGSNALYDDDASVDVADNILDLQVSLGLDRDGNGLIDDATDTTDDDWLYNDAGDDEKAPQWAPILDADGNVAGFGRRLFYVRINTLVRTDKPDVNFTSPAVVELEDHRYDEPPLPTDETMRQERMFRRRLARTVVDLRNV